MLGFLILVIIGVVIALIVFAVYAGKRKNRKNAQYVPVQENITPQQEEIRKTLAQTLKELRNDKNMTQEFVAESLGVTRQAVSKWENGSSEPSTSNLIAIAKLYEVAPEELLKKLI
ncbi:MAG: helix-turn-helix transcriptional regulator [Ruminococcaceae bacterium]|nr:helix-turn-helix transcriptional regulator [Oscillospiraceae bacterium]